MNGSGDDASKSGTHAVAPISPPLESRVDRETICQWVLELGNPETRENALRKLSEKNDDVPDLAVLLWHSFGTVAALIIDITNIYPAITPPTLTMRQSTRVRNALVLVQCMAVHPETASNLLQSNIPFFLYPFLQTTTKTLPFENLRAYSLGTIVTLAKTGKPDVIPFLLTSEIIPLCLRIMESGLEIISRILATYILMKILMDDTGLNFICQTPERASPIFMALGSVVVSLVRDPSAQLLKIVLRCYIRLADNALALETLRQFLPYQFRDNTFSAFLQEDQYVRLMVTQLLRKLERTSLPAAMSPRHTPM